MLTTLVLAIAMSAPLSLAADDDGVPVTVRVLDTRGEVIPTATVRHRDEKQRHRVNTVTGEWIESVLYLDDGTAIVLEKGMELRLEISAPMFLNKDIIYTMRKRKNVVVVELEDFSMEAEDESEIQIGFGDDNLLDK